MTARDSRRTTRVPASWLGVPIAGPVGWAVLALALVIATMALSRDALIVEISALPLGFWALMISRWIRCPDASTGLLTVVVTAVVAMSVYATLTPAAGVVFAVAVVSAQMFWVRQLTRRARSLVAWVAVAECLADVTSDCRALSSILTPGRRSGGLPATWHVSMPPTPTTAKRLGEVSTMVSALLGHAVSVRRIGKEMQIISDVSECEDKQFIELNEVLDSMVAGAVVTGVNYRDDGSAQSVTITWPARMSARVRSNAYRSRIVANLSDALGMPSASAKWDAQERTATIARLAPMPEMIPHPPRRDGQSTMTRFGRFRDGSECTWDLGADFPHVLIVGTTGGGKTSLMLTLLTDLPESAEIFGVDAKFMSLAGLELIPGARGREAASEPGDMVEVLEKVASLTMRRVRDVRAGRVRASGLHPVVLVIDEAQTMVSFLNQFWRTPDAKSQYCALEGLEKAPAGSEHPSIARIVQILQLGREAHVHMILASQQPAAKWMGTDARDQFAVRIGLGNLPEITSRMTFDSAIASTGLEPIKGRAWVSTALGQAPRQAQIYFTPKIRSDITEDERAILAGLGIVPPDDYLPRMDAEFEAERGFDPGAHVVSVSGSVEDCVVRDSLTAECGDAATVPVAPGALEDGARVLIDGSVLATVECVEPEQGDGEYLAVLYVTDDGQEGALFLTDESTVDLVIA